MAQESSFGYWLRLKRKSLDLTRESLADRVGCSAAMIRKVEAEERRPSSQIVERLADIFNIPASERDSFLRFARGDWYSVPPELVETSPWNAAAISSRTNLPSVATPLIGREKDLEIIRGYLKNDEIRLVTLLGPPGIGKTRLSLAAAQEGKLNFPEGVFFTALAALDDPNLVPSTILQAIRYIETRDQSVTTQLISGIGDKHLLLVLDNCEHLIDAIAQQSSDLLSACPHLKILATSRQALRIPGEWLYNVPPLSVPKESAKITPESISVYPALALFEARARAARSDFVLDTANIQSFTSICAQLDGLPLAIELIASRVRWMPPIILLEQMTDQFVLSTDGMRAVSSRQKSLNNAIGWSYSALSNDEQRLFCGLSVFSGGFTLQVAESLFHRDFSARTMSDILASLLDKSLLLHTLDACGEIRYDMLLTIRRFGLNRLIQAGDEPAVRQRHLAYFLEFAESSAEEINGPDQARWFECLEIEHDNFRAALDQAVSTQDTESALRLLCALGWPWEVRGHYREAGIWLDRIRTRPNLEEFPAIYARLLNHIGRHCWVQGNIREARALLAESQAISEKMGAEGEPILAETLNWLGLVVQYHDKDRDSAKSLFQRGLDLFHKWGDQRGTALSTFHLGIVESEINEDTAFILLENSLTMFQQFGDLFFIARVSVFLGYLFLRSENYDKARQLFDEQLRMDQTLHYWDGIADGWINLGNLYRQKGKLEQSVQCYEEGFAVCSEHGLNDFQPLFMLGLLSLDKKDFSLAMQYFRNLLTTTQRLDQPGNVSDLLAGLAAAASGANHPEHAAKLIGAAQAVREDKGEANDIHDFGEFTRYLQTAKEQLGDQAFDSLQNEGRMMSLEQAIAFARGVSSNESEKLEI